MINNTTIYLSEIRKIQKLVKEKEIWSNGYVDLNELYFTEKNNIYIGYGHVYDNDGKRYPDGLIGVVVNMNNNTIRKINDIEEEYEYYKIKNVKLYLD